MTGKRGRPRKYPEITKEKLKEVQEIWEGKDAFAYARKLEEEARKRNPDCEPATKGYVKCIARSLIVNSGHKHDVKRTQLVDTLGIFTVGAALVSGILYLTDTWQPITAPIFWMSLIVFFPCLFEDNGKQEAEPSVISNPDLPLYKKYIPRQRSCEDDQP